MSNGPPLPPACTRSRVAVTLVALSACLILGCTSKEAPAPSSVHESATMPIPGRPPKEAKLLDLPATAKGSADATAAASRVKVEPVSPDELRNFIASQRGKVVFVDFWATYCLPCREKYPRTLALAKKYRDQGLTTISMSMDSPEPSYQKKILDFLTQQNSQIKNFANRLEDTDAAFGALEIAGGALPHYKIYRRNGKLRNKFGGDPDHPFDDADIERALMAALKEH
jgi:thiol-disulfide isomerase/thioredoxin